MVVVHLHHLVCKHREKHRWNHHQRYNEKDVVQRHNENHSDFKNKLPCKLQLVLLSGEIKKKNGKC